MTVQMDFNLPDYQDGNITISLAPPTNISGWTIQLDTMYRFDSPQPIFSLYMASGFTTGQSGLTMVNATTGVFSAFFSQTLSSGLSQVTNALTYISKRTDSGNVLPLVAGYRLLPPQ